MKEVPNLLMLRWEGLLKDITWSIFTRMESSSKARFEKRNFRNKMDSRACIDGEMTVAVDLQLMV